MSEPLSRRHLLEAAGGITFLALTANGSGAYAVERERLKANGLSLSSEPLPMFTAQPYIQPGPVGKMPVDGAESMVIAWQTNNVPAEFTVAVSGKGVNETNLHPTRTERFVGKAEDEEGRWNYSVTLQNLSLSARYTYTVRMNGKTLAEGYFTTRKRRGQKTCFLAFGDNSFGDISDRMIAYQAYRARPDFVMNTGDNVYEDGLDNEYSRFFFPVYNADVPHPQIGAPLLRSVPFYTVMANHDIHGKDAQKRPVADFKTNPDSLAYFTAMHLPLNGHEAAQTTPIIGPEETLSVFRKAAGNRFPRMATYSFDYGDGHFLCLDSNLYVDTNDPALHRFIETDLSSTDATWKFVVFHHPSFNVGWDHYSEQHMRVLSPLFEKQGVDVVFHGHEHNYQRTRPLRFTPKDPSKGSNLHSKDRFVPGAFVIDRNFDGISKTRPDGVVYITTGAGGKHLYDKQDNARPERWRHPEDDNVDYVARFVSDRHSLTVLFMDQRSLLIHQIDLWGNQIDRCLLRK